MLEGGCHCGAIRYTVSGDPVYHALCHCSDCRGHAGAPMVSWSAFPAAAVTVTKGTPKSYESSAEGRRQFCGDCGTGLFFTNATVLPGLIDVQSSTLDDPEALAPQIQVQAAERLGWMSDAHNLPAFERYPSAP